MLECIIWKEKNPLPIKDFKLIDGRRDLIDFPNNLNAKLPYIFDLLHDIKDIDSLIEASTYDNDIKDLAFRELEKEEGWKRYNKELIIEKWNDYIENQSLNFSLYSFLKVSLLN